MNQNTKTIPAPIGAAIQGGFFAGLITIGWETYALVVAPKEGETVSTWHDSMTSVPGAESYNDGVSNTAAMLEAGSPLAKWARGLSIGGHDDWYLPSRDELELMYRNLKPTTQENSCSFRDGDNPSSMPVGYPYTLAAPVQTVAGDFQEGGDHALAGRWYWSSTQYAGSPNYAWDQDFSNGNQINFHKSNEGRARAVRRFKI